MFRWKKDEILILYCRSRDGIEFFGSVSRFSDGLLQNELKLMLSPADRYAEYKCRGLNLRFDPVVEKTVHLDIAGESYEMLKTANA